VSASGGDRSGDLLAEVAAGTLEACAFLFMERSSSVELSVEAASDAVAASISIGADTPVTLKMTASRPLLVEIAANMLGTETDDPEASAGAEAAIAEVLNIIAGSFVARAYGTEKECRVGIPERTAPMPAPSDGVTVMLLADAGGFLRLELQ
jgi:hypothetical protein